MINGSVKTCVAAFFLALTPVAADSQQAAPDLVVLNGKMFSSEVADPYVI